MHVSLFMRLRLPSYGRYHVYAKISVRC